ncbi:MAG: DNA-deoxyinosine glycosylase [bacterium]
MTLSLSNDATSFAPIIGAKPHTLILGSMPGQASLTAQQYYAHPRNAFWFIMQQTFAIPDQSDYVSRCNALIQHRIAVWDVIQHCQRQGSLDTAIQEQSIQANNFSQFFTDYPSIEHILFNGAKAEQSYRRYVLPNLSTNHQQKTMHRLPSTSPAMASLKPADKLKQWQPFLLG